MFPEKTIHKLYSISKGIPRVINLVCDRSLLGAYAENKKSIEIPLLQTAAKEVLGKSLILHKDENKTFFRSMMVSNNWVAILGLCIACLTLGIVLSTFFLQGSVRNQSVSITQAPTDLSKDRPINVPVDLPPASLRLPVVGGGAKKPNNLNRSKDVVARQELKIPIASLPMTNSRVIFEELLAKGKLTEQLSYVSLMRLWGIQYKPEQDGFACRYATEKGVNCLSKIGSVGVVAHLGLPAILTLFDNEGSKHFVVVSSISDASVRFMVDDLSGIHN